MCVCVCVFIHTVQYALYIPLLIISREYIITDSAVCGIYITRHIIIDVHHWNSTFQLTAFACVNDYRCTKTNNIIIVEMTNLWWVGSLLLVLCMVSIALLIVAAEAVTARLAGSD